MRRAVVMYSVVVLAAGCSAAGDGADAGTGVQQDGGADAGSPWAVTTLDPSAAGESELAIALSGDEVHAAYFAEVGPQGDAGVSELRHVASGGAPEKVASVRNHFGVSLAMESGGSPAIAYLGGAAYGLYWQESDLALARKTGGAWASQVVASKSNDVVSGQAVSDTGEVVGLWPALAVDAAGKLFVAYRDVHGGQFGVGQDYAKSDLEIAEGAPGAWARSMAVLGANSTVGYGARTQVAMGASGPLLAFSVEPSGPMDQPRGVWVVSRSGSKWSAAQEIFATGDTRIGPSLAFDGTAGFGIAVEDVPKGTLDYLESADGAAWQPPDPVHGSGTGGMYPSVAFDPGTHEPSIAYYVCATRPAAVSCPPDEDELVLATRRGGNWVKETIDPDGGYFPRLAFAGPGKPVVVYKDVQKQSLKLARLK